MFALGAAVLMMWGLGSSAADAQSDARIPIAKSVPTNTSPAPPQTLQEVTVTAQRAKLANSVSAFVHNVTGPLFEGGIPRWGKPVCPLVSGLRPEAVEFVLARLRDVARAAGVRLGGKECHPNLYILVNKQPQQLLRAMDSHHRWFTFGNDAHSGVVNEFESIPGAVRVLYRDAPTAIGVHSYPYVSSAKVGPITLSGDSWFFDSHAAGYLVGWYLFRAFVIVDGSELKGVTLGQFADYVAMVGLAQVKPSDGLADAPTILTLFDGGLEARPTGMSDWDRAFLKAMYTTNPGSHAQRMHIAQAMLGAIAH